MLGASKLHCLSAEELIVQRWPKKLLRVNTFYRKPWQSKSRAASKQLMFSYHTVDA